VIEIFGRHTMLPLLVIGGVIGAIASIAKGGSWLSDQISGSDGTASAGGKGGLAPLTEAQSSSFAATLAAQAAGQGVPTSALATVTPPAPASTMIPQLHGTDYDSLARLQAGTFAYSHIGEQHKHHATQPHDADGSTAVAGS
jgi:hypothetical protein